MNKVHFLDSPEVQHEIENRLLGMLNRLQHVTGQTVTISLSTVVSIADTYAQSLTGVRGEKPGRLSAELVRDHLFHPTELYAPDTWSTPLGQAVGWWIGGPASGMSRPCVMALLNSSRQYVHKLIQHGTLRENTWVIPASVVEVMRAKYPHDFIGQVES